MAAGTCGRDNAPDRIKSHKNTQVRFHLHDAFKKSSKPKQFVGGGVWGDSCTLPGLASKMTLQCGRWDMGLGELWELGTASRFRFS